MPADVDVVIVGGGPTGLMLAAELRLGGVDPVVLERLPEISDIPKGNGLVGQIVPMLDYRGLRESFAAGSTWAGPIPRFSFGPVELDLSMIGASPLHIIAIPQRRIEHLLDEHLRRLGGTVRRGHEVTAASQDGNGVTVDVAGPDGGYRLHARYLVGCDGAHSPVRKLAGIGFPGVTSRELSRIGRVLLPTARIVPETGEVDLPGVGRLPAAQMMRSPGGAYSLAPLTMLDKDARPGSYIIFVSEDDASPVDDNLPMTLEELRASLARVLGADVPMAEPQLLTRVVGNSRQADRYRSGRMLLAGDAAHVFGLALNVGLLDAVNLGWKLAAEVAGWAPADLLDSYHAERHPVGERAILSTRAQRALSGRDEGAEALRAVVGELLRYEEPVRHIGEMLQGSDIRYRMAPDGPHAHPLLGRFAPDLRLETDHGATRVAELMRPGRPLLLDLTPDATLAELAQDWRNRVSVVTGRCAAPGAPAGLLIRPDAYVAWAADPGGADPGLGLHDALGRWFGPTDGKI